MSVEVNPAFPDRACEVGGPSCDGVVIFTYGDHQLCTGHALRFSNMVHETMPARLEGWIVKMRKQGGES